MTRHSYICTMCNEAFDDKAELTVVEDGTPYRKELCDECIAYCEEHGLLTRCEMCDKLFLPRRLKVNPENNVREICPYCGKIWCK